MSEGAAVPLAVTAKVVKVTAHVEIHTDDGRCIGTTTVDLTPNTDSQQTLIADDLRRRDLQQTTQHLSRP